MDRESFKEPWKWSFGYLLATTLVFVIAQCLKISMADSENDTIVFLLNGLNNLLPIAASGYLCWHYCQDMKRDIKRKQLGDSIYPSLMVAQGTYYTFVGISIVLYTFDGSDVTNIISGTKLAFCTSVVGLLASVAAKIYLKRATEEYGDEADAEYQYYDEAAFFEMMKKINASINDQNKIIADHLDKRLDIVTAGLRDMVQRVTEAQLKKTEECYASMAQISEKINNTLLDDVNKYLQTINESVNRMNSSSVMLKTQLAETKKLFSSLNRTLNGVNSNTEKFVVRIDENFSKLDGNFANFISNTEDSIGALRSALDDLSKTISQMDFSKVTEVVDTAISPLVEQAGTYSSEMKQVTEQVRTMTTSSLHLMENFNDSLSQLQEQQAKYNDVFKEYIDGTRSKMTVLGQSVEEDLKNIQGAFARLTTAFDTSTKHIQDSNVKNADDLKKYYENMNKYTASAAMMAENMDNLHRKMQKQMEQHKAMLETFKNVADCAYDKLTKSGRKDDMADRLLAGMNNAYENLKLLCESMAQSQGVFNREMNEALHSMAELFNKAELVQVPEIVELSEMPDGVVQDEDSDYDVEPPEFEEMK